MRQQLPAAFAVSNRHRHAHTLKIKTNKDENSNINWQHPPGQTIAENCALPATSTTGARL